MPDKVSGEPGNDSGPDEPSLELPSWGSRRKRRRAGAEPVTPEAPEPAAPVAEPRTTPLSVVSEPTPAPETEPETGPEDKAEPGPRARKERSPGGTAVAVLTGLVVGLGIVGLTWASLRLCEQVQGTSSCGDAGYGLLIAILVVMIVVGALLLRLTRVPEPGSTSFLAVGLTAVLALLFLVDSLMDRPMVVVIPVITAGTFALAHWVTRTFAGTDER